MKAGIKQERIRECLYRAFSLFCQENQEFIDVTLEGINLSGDLRSAKLIVGFPSQGSMEKNLPNMSNKLYDITANMKKLIETRFFPKIKIEGVILENNNL